MLNRLAKKLFSSSDQAKRKELALAGRLMNRRLIATTRLSAN